AISAWDAAGLCLERRLPRAGHFSRGAAPIRSYRADAKRRRSALAARFPERRAPLCGGPSPEPGRRPGRAKEVVAGGSGKAARLAASGVASFRPPRDQPARRRRAGRAHAARADGAAAAEMIAAYLTTMAQRAQRRHLSAFFVPFVPLRRI